MTIRTALKATVTQLGLKPALERVYLNPGCWVSVSNTSCATGRSLRSDRGCRLGAQRLDLAGRPALQRARHPADLRAATRAAAMAAGRSSRVSEDMLPAAGGPLSRLGPRALRSPDGPKPHLLDGYRADQLLPQALPHQGGPGQLDARVPARPISPPHRLSVSTSLRHRRLEDRSRVEARPEQSPLPGRARRGSSLALAGADRAGQEQPRRDARDLAGGREPGRVATLVDSSALPRLLRAPPHGAGSDASSDPLRAGPGYLPDPENRIKRNSRTTWRQRLAKDPKETEYALSNWKRQLSKEDQREVLDWAHRLEVTSYSDESLPVASGQSATPHR